MPTARVFTPGLEQMREYAHMAKDRADGLNIDFLSTSGGWENAKRKSRTFQCTFSSFRAKERRRVQNRHGEREYTVDTEIKGPWDTLACIRSELPNGEGFRVSLVPVSQLNLEVVVTDRRTGEAIDAFDPKLQRLQGIITLLFTAAKKSTQERVHFVKPLNADEEHWLFANYPDSAEELYTLYKFTRFGEPEFTRDTNTSDLNDLPMDMSMFGGGDLSVDNEGEGE